MVVIGWVWNTKYFHASRNVSEKNVSRGAGCTDSLSHSFSKRATIRGIAKGARTCPHTPNNLLPSHVLFQAENVPKPFSAGVLPRTSLGGLRRSPDPLIGWGGDPSHSPPLRRLCRLERGPPSARRSRAPKGVKTALTPATDTTNGHHQRTSSQQFYNLLYNKYTTNGQKFCHIPTS